LETYVSEAKLRGMSPWLGFTDVFERIVSGRTKVHELGRLLPWHWQAEQAAVAGNA
jgi:transposase